jgi:hypothetical protein
VALNADSNTNTYAYDINDAGDVVGYIDTPQGQRPVLWEVIGTTVTEHVLTDGYCATGVNELQQFVGESGGHAVYWESYASQPVFLPPIVSPGYGLARELNDQGVIVGWSHEPGSSVHYPATWWVVNGLVTAVLPLPGGEGEANDLTNNDADGVATIVGSANGRPVTWQVASNSDGSLTLVSGPEDVDPVAVGYGQGFGINAGGDVCGEFGFLGSTEGYSAVRAWNGGSLEILGQLNERQLNDRNWALSINDAGQAVGCDSYTTRSGAWKRIGVLWQIDGSAKELLKLVTGWYSIQGARGINNQGVIAAEGQLAPYGAGHALIMIPPQ